MASARDEWRANWKLVLAASVGFSFFSVQIASTGLFFEPLTKEFGWSRSLLSSGPSIASVMTAVLGPFAGALLDRFGSRRIALPGIVLTILAMCAFSLASGAEAQWIGFWVVYGLVAVSIKSTAWTAAVLGVFEKSRGLALSLALAGTAVTNIILPPLGNWLITEFGWRAAFVWLALGWGGLAFVLCLAFLFDAHHRRGKARAEAVARGEVHVDVDLPGLTPREALRDWSLWKVGISNVIVLMMTLGLTIHLFPILNEAGVSRTRAAVLLSFAGVAAIVGKLLTGYLLDRIRPNWVAGLTLGAGALAFALLIYGIKVPALILLAMLVNGYVTGTTTQITGFLTGSYAGMKNFGKIYGVMGALMALAAGVGPMLAGVTYDQFGGYGVFLGAGSIACALAGMLLVTLPPYPKWEAKHEPEPEGHRRPS